MTNKSIIVRHLLAAIALGTLQTACGPPADRVEPIAMQTPSGEDRMSQPARTTQRMGSTEVTVVYNRPMARGRELFGALVPWDSLWNPGADEATRIETNEDLSIAGENLPAGRYSIWAVPGPQRVDAGFQPRVGRRAPAIPGGRRCAADPCTA